MGTISVFDIPVHALVDLGSMHSYICIAILRERNLQAEAIGHKVLVSNSLGQSVIVNRVFRECSIRIQGYEFLGDLMELPFWVFDVILGWIGYPGIKP